MSRGVVDATSNEMSAATGGGARLRCRGRRGGRDGLFRGAHLICEELELQIFEQLVAAAVCRAGPPGVMEVDCDRRFDLDGHQLLRKKSGLLVRRQFLSNPFLRDVFDVVVQFFKRSIFLNQWNSGLLADAFYSGNIVRGVTDQRQHIHHVLRAPPRISSLRLTRRRSPARRRPCPACTS